MKIHSLVDGFSRVFLRLFTKGQASSEGYSGSPLLRVLPSTLQLCSFTSPSNLGVFVASGHKGADNGDWISLPCCPTSEHTWTTPQILPARDISRFFIHILVAVRNICPLWVFLIFLFHRLNFSPPFPHPEINSELTSG